MSKNYDEPSLGKEPNHITGSMDPERHIFEHEEPATEKAHESKGLHEIHTNFLASIGGVEQFIKMAQGLSEKDPATAYELLKGLDSLLNKTQVEITRLWKASQKQMRASEGRMGFEEITEEDIESSLTEGIPTPEQQEKNKAKAAEKVFIRQDNPTVETEI